MHLALVSLAIRMKSARRLMAITDGTAGSGLPVGSRTRLGDQEIVVTGRTAELADGTLAGSMPRALQVADALIAQSRQIR